mmetsp:Transcript_4026/g.9229  ORF Transcript_4026/g.9229 Transcript_4026/m.9229 type:complete len:216 (-) Transcript_4026:77-724(-)
MKPELGVYTTSLISREIAHKPLEASSTMLLTISGSAGSAGISLSRTEIKASNPAKIAASSSFATTTPPVGTGGLVRGFVDVEVGGSVATAEVGLSVTTEDWVGLSVFAGVIVGLSVTTDDIVGASETISETVGLGVTLVGLLVGSVGIETSCVIRVQNAMSSVISTLFSSRSFFLKSLFLWSAATRDVSPASAKSKIMFLDCIIVRLVCEKMSWR